MGDFIDIFWEGIIKTSFLEWVAVISSILYVLFATYQKIACWIFALTSSLLYIIICIKGVLYIESGLHIFYFVMAVYGWMNWSKKKEGILKIVKWSIQYHLLNILFSLALTLTLGIIFATYTDQAHPYLDAATTSFSLTATFMVVKKVLENWIYWIIIDLFSIYLYTSRELYLSGILFLIFTGIAIFGFIKWQKKYRLQNA